VGSSSFRRKKKTLAKGKKKTEMQLQAASQKGEKTEGKGLHRIGERPEFLKNQVAGGKGAKNALPSGKVKYFGDGGGWVWFGRWSKPEGGVWVKNAKSGGGGCGRWGYVLC